MMYYIGDKLVDLGTLLFGIGLIRAVFDAGNGANAVGIDVIPGGGLAVWLLGLLLVRVAKRHELEDEDEDEEDEAAETAATDVTEDVIHSNKEEGVCLY